METFIDAVPVKTIVSMKSPRAAVKWERSLRKIQGLKLSNVAPKK